MFTASYTTDHEFYLVVVLGSCHVRKGLKSRTSLTMLEAFSRSTSISFEMRLRSATSSVSRISSPVKPSLYNVDTSSFFCREKDTVRFAAIAKQGALLVLEQ